MARCVKCNGSMLLAQHVNVPTFGGRGYVRTVLIVCGSMGCQAVVAGGMNTDLMAGVLDTMSAKIDHLQARLDHLMAALQRRG